MCIHLGIKITGKCDLFVHTCIHKYVFLFLQRLIKYLFTLRDVKSFLSEKIGHNLLEQFKGCQRQRGRSSDNPNVKEFCKNTQALRVVNSLCTNGNCRDKKRASMTESHLEVQPLPNEVRGIRKKVNKTIERMGI